MGPRCGTLLFPLPERPGDVGSGCGRLVRRGTLVRSADALRGGRSGPIRFGVRPRPVRRSDVVPAQVPVTQAVVQVAVLPAGLVGCAAEGAKRALAGRATSTGPQTLAPVHAPPERVYVADFAVDEGAVKRPSGLLGGLEQAAQERPRLL